MTERRYTLAEIDAMRDFLRQRAQDDFWEDRDEADGNWREPLWADVEQQLRTAMIGGVDPSELTKGNADEKT